ncbi:aldo/keto reductase [Xylogone sp. PMI_703]|nr:aldo/keto reductase [Xylogone sp. PMI_703]
MSASLARAVKDTSVEYRNLGKSGLRVSYPILGGMSFGDSRWLDWVLNEDQALPILKRAYDLGINTWDTANVYSNGASEQIFGKALRQYQIPRRRVVLMTKCGRHMSEDGDISTTPLRPSEANKSKDYVNQGGLSRGAIVRAVEGSLKRLETDYIDVLQIHRFDPVTPIEETMGTLHDLVRSGRVNYIGASSMWTYEFAMMQHVAEKNGWTKFISMQNHYNLLYREEERDMNRYCRATGVGLIPWSPLADGHLARDPEKFGHTLRSAADAISQRFDTGQTKEDKEIIRRVKEVAEQRGWTMAQVSLAWLRRRVTAPIVGLSSIGRVEEVARMRSTLNETEEKYLEAPYRPKGIQGHE